MKKIIIFIMVLMMAGIRPKRGGSTEFQVSEAAIVLVSTLISCRTISQVLLDLLKVEATHTLTSPTTGSLAPSPRSLAL